MYYIVAIYVSTINVRFHGKPCCLSAVIWGQFNNIPIVIQSGGPEKILIQFSIENKINSRHIKVFYIIYYYNKC